MMEESRPRPPYVSLPHEHAGVRSFPETQELGPVPGAIYGLMAEFVSVEELADATRRAHAEGYRKMDAFTPF
ncbi:MAG: hypothetical protein ACRDIB_13835, partial [Ardenticatenaceae bacterium]